MGDGGDSGSSGSQGMGWWGSRGGRGLGWGSREWGGRAPTPPPHPTTHTLLLPSPLDPYP